MIAGGRLRAVNRASGRAMQAAIGWAAGGLGYAIKHDFLRVRAIAAERLSVSVNTARTQLRRIFEKTGVHNQSALVRLMLSIAPPLH